MLMILFVSICFLVIILFGFARISAPCPPILGEPSADQPTNIITSHPQGNFACKNKHSFFYPTFLFVAYNFTFPPFCIV